ncbi:hypothetical protein M407DRAFT_5656 [Tulasnella calospora MUT 4182]|uniref:Elongation factor 1-gamma n=1 Tax=Tulasnella calospora MUT 4182 TaxID=1051891 RepID=A0A0C3M9T6_9AGAM|nr:hypothetical protein M407DRAFT_5656 [Tulasnella calospora MUT 4182]
MSVGKLYSIPTQPQGEYIRAVAAFGGVQIEVVPDFKLYVDNKKPEYLEKFPLGKIPGFEAQSGLNLSETFAIGRYVASFSRKALLLGSTLEEAAQVDQWVSFAEDEVFSNGRIINNLLNGNLPYNKATRRGLSLRIALPDLELDNFYRERNTRALKFLESHLATRTFLVSERITLADISVASVLKSGFFWLIGASERATIPNTIRFYETVANQPAIKAIWGDLEYVDKSPQYVPPAKPKKEKEAAPATATPKPRPAKKEAEADEEEEPLVPEEPKVKNPLDDLPKSNFNLEQWKREYSNRDTRGAGGSLEWFYQNFDKEGFSLWKCKFKYNEELTLTFMSSNQIGGFFNRLEASRKYLFGSMGVLGEPSNSIIAGCFICRGPDYKPVIDVAPDWESYDFEPINLENEADKAYFEAALAWDLEIDGKKWVDGKNVS